MLLPISCLVLLTALLAHPAAGDGHLHSGSASHNKRGYRTGNYTYIGCYYDRLGDRDLPAPGRLPAPADEAACHAECGRRGFRYFGLQHGVECWCGYAYGGYGPAPEADCNMRCQSNASQACGGSRRNSIFEAHQPRYIGCYRPRSVDPKISGGGGGRGSLSLLSVDSGLRSTSGSVSHLACAWRCSALGYPYLGLRSAAAGDTAACLCGTDYSDGVNEERSAGFCGGSERTAVYQVIDPGFGYRYIGCYKEKCCQDMNMSFLTRPDMSVEVCYYHCLGVPGARFFGLQDGDECHCSASYGKFGQRDGCDVKCAGCPAQKCGGLQRNSVYRLLVSSSDHDDVDNGEGGPSRDAAKATMVAGSGGGGGGA